MAHEPIAPDEDASRLQAVLQPNGARPLHYRFADGEIYVLSTARFSEDNGPVVIAAVVELVNVPPQKARFHRPGNFIQFAPSELVEVADYSSATPQVLWSRHSPR